MTPTSLFLAFAVIYLLAFVQYWIERPAMSPSERRHNGIVALIASVTAIVLVGCTSASIWRNVEAYRFGPWSFLVLAVPIVQVCSFGLRIVRILHQRRLPAS